MTVKGTGAPAPRREQRREEILAIAIRLMNHQGVPGLVLADVAERAGMTKANLTYYFRRKEDLAALCLDRTFEAYEAMIQTAARARDPRERFRSLFAQFFDRARQAARGEVHDLVVLTSLRALDDTHGRDALHRFKVIARDTADLFQVEEGESLSGLERAVRGQIALTHMLWAAAWIEFVDEGDLERAGLRLYDMIEHGLLAGMTRTAPPRPLAPSAEDPRGEFYRAAIQTINVLGYRGASVDRISAALNATKGSVYHHHASKEELVSACADRSFDLIWKTVRRTEAAREPGQALRSLVFALLAAQTGPEGPFLRASVVNSLPGELRQSVITRWTRLANHLGGVVFDSMVSGEARPVEANLAAQIILAGVNASDELRRGLPSDHSGDIVRLCASPLLHGLFARPTDPSPSTARHAAD